MRDEGQVIRASKFALRKLLKADILIVDDMIQTRQREKGRPTPWPYHCAISGLGRKLPQRLKDRFIVRGIEITNRNHRLRLRLYERRQLQQLGVPFLIFALRNGRHQMNSENDDAAGQINTKLRPTGKAPLVDDLAPGNW